MKTQLSIDERIGQLETELNQLLVEKFVDELTFEDIKIVSQVHTITKIPYTKMNVRVPKCKVGKGIELKDKRVFVFLGKKSEVELRLMELGYRNMILKLMKDNVIEKFLNK